MKNTLHQLQWKRERERKCTICLLLCVNCVFLYILLIVFPQLTPVRELLQMAVESQDKEKITNCSEPVWESYDGTNTTIQFVRTSNKSRYLVPKCGFQTGTKNAINICWDLGLEPVTMVTQEDIRILISEVLNGKVIDPKIGYTRNIVVYWIGTDTFWNRGYQCGRIECKVAGAKEDCVYLNSFCGQPDNLTGIKVMPICQYPGDYFCSAEMYEFLEENYRDDESANNRNFTDLGHDAIGRKYYGSLAQASWEVAVASCRNASMELLYFEKGKSSYNHEIEKTRNLDEIIDGYIGKLHIPSWTKSIWTSGRFIQDFGNQSQFRFQNVLYDIWNYEDNFGRWKWSDAEISDPRKEICMSISSTNPLTMRSTLCNSRKFYICQKDASDGN